MARIAFLQEDFTEYLGVMYLSSCLKARGNEVEVFISSDIRKQVRELKRYQPHITGFSCMTGMHFRAIETLKAIKSSMRTLTIVGGPHPTFFPEVIEEEGVDIVCMGEGEGPLLDLADAVDRQADIRGIPNLWVKQEGRITRNDTRLLVENLDSLAFPDRSLYYSRYAFMNHSRKIFVAGRGCPYQCTYCFNGAWRELYKGKGKNHRMRSVENIIAEIEDVCKRYDTKTVYMLDDTFIVNKPWAHRFLEAYKLRVGLPFICLVRADLMTEEIVKELKAANCYAVYWGIESGDEKLRNLVLGKQITDEQVLETASLLKRYKIRFRTYNMLGLPGESLDDAFKTVDLNIKIKTDFPWCSLLQPYPKTPIERYVRDQGMVRDEPLPRHFFKKSILKLSHNKEIANLQKLFYWTVKIPFLKPLTKILIKFPSNIIFDALFLMGYARSYCKSERLRLGEVLRIGCRSMFSFFR